MISGATRESAQLRIAACGCCPDASSRCLAAVWFGRRYCLLTWWSLPALSSASAVSGVTAAAGFGDAVAGAVCCEGAAASIATASSPDASIHLIEILLG